MCLVFRELLALVGDWSVFQYLTLRPYDEFPPSKRWPRRWAASTIHLSRWRKQHREKDSQLLRGARVHSLFTHPSVQPVAVYCLLFTNDHWYIRYGPQKLVQLALEACQWPGVFSHTLGNTVEESGASNCKWRLRQSL